MAPGSFVTIKSIETICDFDKTFLFSSDDYFCQSTQQKNCREFFFFCNKTKAEAFLENRGHTFLDIEKNFKKKAIAKLDIVKLDTVREYLA